MAHLFVVPAALAIEPFATFSTPAQVQLGGLLGQALDANHSGRLLHFIQDETSPAIALFRPESVQGNQDGDWYGEHAGKWLYAAARAANRTGDPVLAARVQGVAHYLVGCQAPNGYLGTYAPERRFTEKGALGKRTWDIWVHSYLILGLLETNKYFPDPSYVEAAKHIGDLCWETFAQKGINVTDLGNHFGMSSSVLLDSAAELFLVTGERKYLDLAKLILDQANQRAEFELLPRSLAGADASVIGDGKVYQLLWNFVGLAKLYRATGDKRFLQALQLGWDNIRQDHLTLGGGPWGGVGDKSREVFNPKTFFSPQGFVETCSTFSWIQLNRELLGLTGEAKYAEEIEKSAYNELLGAQAPNGEDWCYYSYPNGKRVYTTYWRCCKSSGAMALEELPSIAYTVSSQNNIMVNLYGPNQATLKIPQAGIVNLEQTTEYPFDGVIRLRVNPENPSDLAISLRIPTWADNVVVKINNVAETDPIAPGSYITIKRTWRANDEITLVLPMLPKLHKRTNRSLQEAKLPDGNMLSQEVVHFDYIAITRGPLVYATGLIDGFKMEETIRWPNNSSTSLLEELAAPAGFAGRAIRLNLGYREPLLFLPYYETGGRLDGAWRLTWMQIAPP